MSRAISKTNTINTGAGGGFFTLAFVAGLGLMLYLFFIGQTVFKLVAEKNISNDIRTLSAEISELELQTLSLNDTISIERAYELGFVNAKKMQYVSRKGELTLR